MMMKPTSTGPNWGMILNSLGQGLMAAGSPAGWSAFGPAMANAQQNYQASAIDRRRLEMAEQAAQHAQEQWEIEQRTANQTAAAKAARDKAWQDMVLGPGLMSAEPTPATGMMQPGSGAVTPVGRMGAIAANMQPSATPESRPWGPDNGLGFGSDVLADLTPQQRQMLSLMEPEDGMRVLTERAFAKPEQFKPNLTTFYEGDQQYQGYLGPDNKPVRVTENSPRWKNDSGQSMAIDFDHDGNPDFVMGNGAPLKLTEAQGKDTGWATRLEGAIGDMTAAEGAGYDPTSGGSAIDYIGQKNIGGLVGNAMTSDAGKRWYRGAKEALAVVLRKDSGGAITPDEFAMYGPIYLPMPWDDAETKRAKNQALGAVLSSLKTTSGGGYDLNKARVAAEAPPAAPATTPARRGPQGAASKPDPLGIR